MPETPVRASLLRILCVAACCLPGACVTVSTTAPGMPSISVPSGSPSSGSPSSGSPGSGSPSSGNPSTSSGTGSPSAGTPSGSTGTSSSSAGTPSGSPSAGMPGGTPAADSGAAAGQPGGQPDGAQSGDQRSAGAGDKQGDAGQQAAGQGQEGQKSDEEILAAALEDFDRSMRRQQAAGEGDQQGAGGAAASEQEPGTGALSRADRSRNLDARMDRELAEFDEMILGERQAVTRRDNEAGYSGPGGIAGQGTGEEPMQTAMVSGGGMSNSDQTASAKSQAIPEDYKIPDDIDAGQDDDIIAKQLREAAMKEKDPELREKLWDEYRKYKKDLQANR